jgi:hypothetical protein
MGSFGSKEVKERKDKSKLKIDLLNLKDLK